MNVNDARLSAIWWAARLTGSKRAAIIVTTVITPISAVRCPAAGKPYPTSVRSRPHTGANDTWRSPVGCRRSRHHRYATSTASM